jgi:hypothetical protein
MPVEKIPTQLSEKAFTSINEGNVCKLENNDLERLVPKHLVHKKLLENVCITSVRQISKAEFVCGAIIPQLQQAIAAIEPAKNILFLSEIGRQAVIACTHHSGVSFDFAFVLKQITSELQTANLWLPQNSRIDEIEIRAIVKTEGDRTTGELEFFHRDKLIVRGHGEGCFMPYDRYLRLRKIGRRKQFSSLDNLLPLLDEVSWKTRQERCISNRRIDASVLEVSSDSRKAIAEATLVVDEQNSFFFDRYCDHVPGILLFQGFNELASRYCADLSPNYITTAELNFFQFAELNYPVKLSVTDSDRINPLNSRIRLQATQNDCVLAEVNLTVSKLEVRND